MDGKPGGDGLVGEGDDFGVLGEGGVALGGGVGQGLGLVVGEGNRAPDEIQFLPVNCAAIF